MTIIDDDTRPKLNASKQGTRLPKKSSNPEPRRNYKKTRYGNFSEGSPTHVMSKLTDISEDKLKEAIENGQSFTK